MTYVFSLRFHSCDVIREYNNILKSTVCIRRVFNVLGRKVGKGTMYHERYIYLCRRRVD